MDISSTRKLPYLHEQDGLETARTVNRLVDGYLSKIRLSKWTNAPTGDDLYDGVMVYADGTSWNPGSGEGLYAYYNAAWNKL